MNNINNNPNYNVIGNGVATRESSQRNEIERSTDRPKKVADILPMECKNWLLHKRYTRHEYKITTKLINQELKNSNNHNEYANSLKGLIFRREGRIQESLDCFRDSCVNNSTNIHHVKNVAKSLFLLGDLRRSIDAYLEAEKMLNSPDWEIYYCLGISYMALHHSEQAIHELSRATELTNDKIPHMALARLAITNKRIDQAIQLYKHVTQSCSDNKEAELELGLIHLQQGDTLKAFLAFGSVLAQSPTCIEALLPTSYIIQNHREYDVALAKYKGVAHSFPESWQLWNNIGMCFCGKQKFIAAITCLKRANFLNPMAWQPSCNLGRVFLMTDQPASAASHLCAAIAAASQNHMPYLLLGVALKKLDDSRGAERALSKAHSLAPNDPVILVNYAIILQMQNKYGRAAEILSDLDTKCTTMDIDSRVLQVAQQLSHNVNEIPKIQPSIVDDTISN